MMLHCSKIVILHHFNGGLVYLGILYPLIDRPGLAIRVLRAEHFSVVVAVLARSLLIHTPCRMIHTAIELLDW